VLAILKEVSLKEKIEFFTLKLQELVKEFPNLFQKEVGVGLMRGLRVKESEQLEKILNQAFEERVLVLKAGRNTLRFLPPLTITLEEIEEGMERLKRGILKIR